MIKAVLIDDERPSLRELEYLLKEDGNFAVVGMFINPLEGIDQINTLQPQVVFLDIHMPQLKGIDAASQILDKCPWVDVIFVTAYDQYAIEAFELHALDYILKPVKKERFDKTLSRIIKKNNYTISPITGEKFKISCLGNFQAGWEGQAPIKWRSEKTKELFAFLLHHEGREVTKEKILEAIWPDTEVVRAIHQLHNGIYYIRKTLDKYDVDGTRIAVEGSYLLKLGEAETDVLLFKKYIQLISKGESSLEALARVEALYSGDYLEGVDWMWADLERERLLMNYIEVVLKLSQIYIQNKKFDQAEEILLKIFKKNPYLEDTTKFLLKLYKHINKRNKAISHFMGYKKILQEELGIEPEEDIQSFLEI